MTRLLNTLLLFISALLFATSGYATRMPADSLLDNYVSGLQTAIKERVKVNRQSAQKDYLLIYDDPAGPFITDFVNNGQYFWFDKGSEHENKLRKVVNDIQAQTGGEKLYVILASIYNYVNLESVNEKIEWKAKDKYKPALHEAAYSDNIWKNLIPKLRRNAKLTNEGAILYVISYFTVDNDGYKVRHKCYYTGSASLVQNGYQIHATDEVMGSGDENGKRVAFLESTIKGVAANMSQFADEIKRVNEAFAKLAAESIGRDFYNSYEGYCSDKLVLKKLALLIDQMGYNAYNAYLEGKKTADSFDPSVFRGFYEGLNAFNESYKKISAQLPNIKTAGELVNALEAFTATELGALTYPERLKAIQLLNQLKELTDDSFWQVLNLKRWANVFRKETSTSKRVVKSEEMLVALVSSTPADQQKLLVADLKGKDGQYTLLKELFYKVDDEPVGENNYTELIQYVAGFVVASADDAALNKLYENNRIFGWSNGVMRNVLDDESGMKYNTLTLNNETFPLNTTYEYYEYKPAYEDDAMGASIEKYRTIMQMERTAQGYYMPKSCSTCVDKRLMEVDDLDMFDMVALIPDKAINFNTGMAIPPDQVTLVPAFFFKWYFQKDRNQDIKTGINITLTAVSTVTAVGTLVNAASWGARIMAAADLVFTTTAMLSQESEAYNKFMKENLGENGYQLFKTVEFGVNLFNAGRGFASLGKGAYNMAKRLSMTFLDMVKKRPDFLAKMRAAYPDKFKALVAWMKDKDLGGTDLAAVANGVREQYKGLDFLQDFKIGTSVTEQTTASRLSHFDDADDVWRDPDAGLFEPGPGGGGGTATAAAVARQKKPVLGVKEVLERLKQEMPTVQERPMNYMEVAELKAQYLEAAQATATAKKAATLKILQSVTGLSKVVLLQVGEEEQLLYAQGEAKTQVEAYIKAHQTQTQPKEEEKDEDTCSLCSKEKLICAIEAISAYPNKRQALTKLCNQVHPDRLNGVCRELIALGPTDMDIFLADVLNNTPPGTGCGSVSVYLAQNIPSLTVDMIRAWDVFGDAGRTCLRISVPHLNKLVTAMTNTRLQNAPYSMTRDHFVNIAYACGQQSGQTQVVDDELFENLNAFANRGFNVRSFTEMLSNLQNGNKRYTVLGANWVLKYMQHHASEFTGHEIRFEESTTFDDGGRRVADVALGDGDAAMYYEFKSYATSSLPPKDFMDQFPKDLMRGTVARLDQLRWIFDGSKTTKTAVYSKIKEALIARKDALNQIKIFDMFNSVADTAGYEHDIIDLDSLMAYIEDEDNQGWFDTIFKISNPQ